LTSGVTGDRKSYAHTFVEVTRSCGDRPNDALLVEIETLINNEFGGIATNVEEAAVYVYRRR
jgi:hypothetical protein